MRLAPFLLMLLISVPARAFESFPEFRGPSETEAATIEDSGRVNDEYASDVLLYMKPSSYEAIWLSKEVAFDTAFGSLTGLVFYTDHRIKLHAHAGEHAEFRITYFDDTNREREANQYALEAIFWATPSLGLALVGEPTPYKRNDDLGLAALIRPAERHEVRLFFTALDVARQKRNDLDDRFIEPHYPLSFGFVGRAWRPSTAENTYPEFVEYGFRREPPVLWVFPTPQYEYQYWKWLLFTHLNKDLKKDLQLSVRIQWDRRLEERTPYGTSTQPHERVITERLQSYADLLFLDLFWSAELTAGIAFSSRNWETLNGRAARLDLMPHGRLDVPVLTRGSHQTRVMMGYDFDLTDLSSEGGGWTGTDPLGTRLHQRFSFGIGYRYKQDVDFMVLGSFDTDDLFKLGKLTWQGGGLQMRFTL